MTEKAAAASADLAAAIALFRKREFAEAAAACERLLGRSPADPGTLHLLSVVETARGRISQAIAAAERLLAIAPDHADARRNLGALLAQQGRLGEALPHLERAVALEPGNRGGLENLGTAYIELGRYAEAVAVFDRAIALAADAAAAHRGRGVALASLGRVDEATASLRRASELDPQAAVNWAELGSVLRRQGDLAAAIDCLKRALELDPGDANAAARLLHQLDQACDWAAAGALRPIVRRQTAAALAAGRRPPEPPFANIGYDDDPASNFALARAWAEAARRRAGPPLEARPAPAADGRIRVGYLSHDFREHAVAQLLVRTIELRDRKDFRVFAYSTGPDDGTPLRRRTEAAFDRFHDLHGRDHRTIAERIAADGTDILVDLTGITQGARLEIAALRPAPVQATWLGFPGSSGADFIDYLIGDPTVTPPSFAPHCGETICRLPHCYLPTDPDQPIAAEPIGRAEYGLPADALVFVSFNQAYKIEPAMFDCWMALLRALPGAVLWLWRTNALMAENLRREAAARGVAGERLIFKADRAPKPRHLARLGLADLALDTRIYNGHTTTIDCLWAGLPVVTLEGRHFASRVSASLLRAVGLPELVARDLETYRAIALEQAQDAEARMRFRAKLRANRSTEPLFDAPRFARNLERAYRAMIDAQRDGGSRRPIEIRD
jgi:protein O-GlcNAc transferase